jgi:hypothetical protein
MALERFLSTQAAILIAGAFVAVGVFFGLRSRSSHDVHPSTAATRRQPNPDPVDPPSSVRPRAAPSPPPPSGAVDREEAARLAAAELEKHRKAIEAACLVPEPGGKVPNVRLVFNLTFDANGQQLARGVTVDRRGGPAEVTACVQQKLPSLAIPPPGAVVAFDLEWTLPRTAP